LILIDYWGEMTRYNQKMQRINPKFTVIGKDRVHPEMFGHCMMAEIFLKTMGYLNDDDNVQQEISEEIINLIEKKNAIEVKLRSMDMIKREIREMNYDDTHYNDFKTEYIKKIEGQ
jgi:hypothetical protein